MNEFSLLPDPYTAHDKVDMTIASSSYIGGDLVILESGNDITITGSDVVSDRGTRLDAKNDINIQAADESISETHFKEVKKSGVMGTGGIGFTIGSAKNSNEYQSTTTTNRGSMVGSLGGNVEISAGNTYTQIGSDVLAGKADKDNNFVPTGDIDITAKNVNIQAAYDTYSGSNINKSKSSGLTVALTGSVVNLANSAQGTIAMAQDVGESRHGRVNAMAAASTAWSAYQTVGAAQEAIANPTNVGVSITVGSSKSKSETHYEGTNAVGSNIAGANVNILATSDAKDSDINIIGSTVVGSTSTTLQADNDINILAATSTDAQHSSNKSSGWNAGLAVGTGGIGFTAGGHVGKGKADGESTTYTNSHVGSLSGVTTITAGDTTNIIGGQVLGDSVTLNTTNLNIESLQDTATYDSKQKSVGGQVTIGAGASASGSFAKSNIESDYASVNEQSGIIAGDGGYTVEVANHTNLTGGIITSTVNAEDNGLNSFTTSTLSASDIDNFSHYEGSAIGISAGVSYSNPNAPTNNQNSNDKTHKAYNPDSKGATKAIGYGSEGESQTSTTYSGINTTNLTILNQANSNTTPTDIHTSTTTDTLAENSGALANTFDAEAMQNELDVQVRVTQNFDRTTQEAKAEIDKKIDEAKAKQQEAQEHLERNPNDISAYLALIEANSDIENMQHLGVLVDSISGALYSPSDSITGTIANTLSPAIVYEIGQQFKGTELENTPAHYLAQALVAGVVAGFAGNDALSATISGGGAEALAPHLASWMYGVKPEDLTSEQKQTISTVISLGSAAIGATTGDTTDIVSSSVAGRVAVEDNAGLQGAFIGGSIELGVQIAPKIAQQLYENGGIWSEINYLDIVLSIDWYDVSAMTAVGAITPNELSMFSSVKNIQRSWEANRKYGKLAEKATKNTNKRTRFENKATENAYSIGTEIGTQGTIAGAKYGIKQTNESNNNGE